jgi:hypothetical protein
MLTVYVYSPEHPLLIRSDVGNVDASADETKITRLQIWIFTNGTHEKVAYLDTDDTSMLNVGEGTAYQLPVSEEFVRNKPDVDVYVMANLPDDEFGNTLVEESTRQQILDAKIPEGFFGLTNYAIPAKGLPMTGSLTAQPVVGEAPVLRVGTTSNIATVRLVRAVSKVRFVFANTVGADPLYIKEIKLDESVIPNEEYLIQQTRTLTTSWNAEAPLWTATESEEKVTEVPNPTIYIYGGQEAQVYENLIDQSGLTTKGPFYLRESDNRLTGKISYSIGGEDKESTFEMDAAGDFRRNHTWIVYAYHAGGNYLQLSAIYVKDWNTTNTKNHDVYNW